jgi:hypothetical protein
LGCEIDFMKVSSTPRARESVISVSETDSDEEEAFDPLKGFSEYHPEELMREVLEYLEKNETSKIETLAMSAPSFFDFFDLLSAGELVDDLFENDNPDGMTDLIDLSKSHHSFQRQLAWRLMQKLMEESTELERWSSLLLMLKDKITRDMILQFNEKVRGTEGKAIFDLKDFN